MCLACSQFHSLKDCYYVFRDQAPKWFKYREDIVAKVAEQMKDEKIKKEIEALKGKRVKRSHSEATTDQAQD